MDIPGTIESYSSAFYTQSLEQDFVWFEYDDSEKLLSFVLGDFTFRFRCKRTSSKSGYPRRIRLFMLLDHHLVVQQCRRLQQLPWPWLRLH